MKRKIILVFNVKSPFVLNPPPYKLSKKAKDFGLDTMPEGCELLISDRVDLRSLKIKLNSDYVTLSGWVQQGQLGCTECFSNHLEFLMKLKLFIEERLKEKMELLESSNPDFSSLLQKKFNVKSHDIFVIEMEKRL